jgi:hypothetical protein
MSEERDFDIESFRKTRSQKIRENLQKFRERMTELVSFVTHRGWAETEAEVRSCKLLHYRTYAMLPSKSGSMPLSGYAVTFTYRVNGKTYDGITISPDEVQERDGFKIRYNPLHPEENNTLDSEISWIDGFMKYYDVLLILAVLALVIAGIALRR